MNKFLWAMPIAVILVSCTSSGMEGGPFETDHRVIRYDMNGLGIALSEYRTGADNTRAMVINYGDRFWRLAYDLNADSRWDVLYNCNMPGSCYDRVELDRLDQRSDDEQYRIRRAIQDFDRALALRPN